MKWQLLFSLLFLGFGPRVFALEAKTRDQLERLEEQLREHIDDRASTLAKLVPLTIVEVAVETEDKQSLVNALAQVLGRILEGSVLVCEACQGTYEETSQATVYESGFVDIKKVRDIYERQGLRPQAALWLRQTPGLLSIRIVSLQNSEVLFATSIDTNINWSARSLKSFSMSRKAERQARGDAIFHGHIDVGVGLLGGGAHVGYSLMQQWGSSNQYLTGYSLNISDPLLGVGLNFFHIMPNLNNALLGAKILLSLPEAIGSLAGSDAPTEASLATLVLMAKYPLLESPELFYFNVFISTAGMLGCGLSW